MKLKLTLTDVVVLSLISLIIGQLQSFWIVAKIKKQHDKMQK